MKRLVTVDPVDGIERGAQLDQTALKRGDIGAVVAHVQVEAAGRIAGCVRTHSEIVPIVVALSVANRRDVKGVIRSGIVAVATTRGYEAKGEQNGQKLEVATSRD